MPLVALTAKWLLDSALAAAVVLTLGAVMLRWVRQPARRQRLGEWALAGCLLVAFLAGMPGLPRWSLGVVDPALLGTRLAAGDMCGIEAFDLAALPGSATSLTLPGRTAPTASNARLGAGIAFPIGPTIVLVIVALYGLAVAVAFVRLVSGLWTLRRLTRTGSPPGPALAALWRELAAELPHPPRLLTSRTLTEPLSFGLWGPTVLIPESFARTGDSAALRVVLTHELVHVRRRDAWTWLLAALVQVLFFYQPAYWWLRRELRLAQEFIADAWAAQRAPSAHHYAACLLQLLGRQPQPIPAGASPILGGRSQFYRRLERLLHQNPPATDRQCGFTWTWLCGLLVLLVALGAGNLTLRAREPVADKNQKPDPARLELRGVRYLLSQQLSTGGWLEQVGPAPTALVLKALLQAGVGLENPQVQRGLACLERFRQEDHGYYADDEPAYNTAIVLSLLTMLPGDGYRQKVAEGREFLSLVHTGVPRISKSGADAPVGNEGWAAAHHADEGVGTTFRTSGLARISWEDASERVPGDVLESYGRMTYASLKSMVYAGLTKDDRRVQQAARWVSSNWTLSCNPGLGTAEGQFYYYLMLAKTLHATAADKVADRRGVSHDWRTELLEQLGQTQDADGSWINRSNGRWLENQPVLVTAYCVLALQEMQP